MNHPAIQAILNMREEANARLARIGQTAVLELLQPLWNSNAPISAISWDQMRDGMTGDFFSTHRVPAVLVRKTDDTLGSGWIIPKKLIPATRKVFEEKIADFVSIPNEVMCLTFGDDASITISSDGKITSE